VARDTTRLRIGSRHLLMLEHAGSILSTLGALLRQHARCQARQRR
jgi:hypothetical protein